MDQGETSVGTSDDERVEALLGRMTTAEKAALTGGDDVWHLPAIERLGIGRLKMSDGPSGVRGAAIGTRRSMAFPCGSAVGATWDVELAARYGRALAAEARSKGVHLLLGPTVGIPRTPLGGRTFESFSEDPLLSAELAVAYIGAVQAGGVGCCVKHFACNDQEHERMTISAEVDERTLREVHLVPFEAAVQRAGSWSIMSAYNRLHGTFCGEHPRLLGEILKEEWGFDGVVVSDWFGTHSTAPAALAGLDVEMPGPPQFLGGRLAAAVDGGDVPPEVLDEHARRILRLAARTGLLDEPPLDGADPAGEGEEDDEERRALARELAVAATVLLANDGLLPLDGSGGPIGSVAVIGPNADLLSVGGGGSAQVLPHRHLSLVDELRARLPGARITHHQGCRLGTALPPVDPRLLGRGVRLDAYVAGEDGEPEGEPVGSQELSTGYFLSFGSPVPHRPLAQLAFRATGTVQVAESGRWHLGIGNAGEARLWLDDELLVENVEDNGTDFFFGMGFGTVSAEVDLEAGRAHELRVELRVQPGLPVIGMRLMGEPVASGDPLDDAVAAAAGADVAVVVVGASAQTETEGMDRPDLALVGDQDELVERVLAANPRTAVVLNAGAPVATPWADRAAAVAVAWYPGEEGAPALADVLTGAAEPGGRLPLTFPARVEDVPVHGEWYPGTDGRVVYGEGTLVGYRHYDTNGVAPAFCFGHGLGYTTFAYGDPEVTVDAEAGTATVGVPITNTGRRAGREVVQVYVHQPAPQRPEPDQVLGGFAVATVEAGATTVVPVVLHERAFSGWDDAAGGWRRHAGPFELRIGSSSRAVHRTVAVELSAG